MQRITHSGALITLNRIHYFGSDHEICKKKCHFDVLEFSSFFVREMESVCCFDAQPADPCFRMCGK